MRGWLSAKWLFAWLSAISCVLIVTILIADRYSFKRTSIAINAVLLVVLVLDIPAVIRFRRQWDREYRAKNNRCVECGYDLAGNVSGICPECGSKIATG